MGGTRHIVRLTSASFTRPADTTAYAVGDLVANSTTAGSVVPIALANNLSSSSMFIRRIKLHKSNATLTNAQFRVHFFAAAPTTITNGDNGAFSVSGVADYLGNADITIDQAFTDGASGQAIPNVGNEINAYPASIAVIYALLEARAAYTPVSGEVFTLTTEEHILGSL